MYLILAGSAGLTLAADADLVSGHRVWGVEGSRIHLTSAGTAGLIEASGGGNELWPGTIVLSRQGWVGRWPAGCGPDKHWAGSVRTCPMVWLTFSPSPMCTNPGMLLFSPCIIHTHAVNRCMLSIARALPCTAGLGACEGRRVAVRRLQPCIRELRQATVLPRLLPHEAHGADQEIRPE